MIKIVKNGLTLDFKNFIFPGGEVGLKLKATDYRYLYEKAEYQTIIARIQNSNDLIELAMAKDALKRIDKTPINLFMPFCPYGQQDRVCDRGESFSVNVMAKFIKNLNFNQVTICDPHSDVMEAVFDVLDIPVKVLSQFDLINKNLEFTNRAKNCVLVSPDAGGNKKTAKIASYFEHKSFVRADKLRDLSNGNILETIVYTDSFNGNDVVVLDDICVGGRTFTELAKVCKAKNCGKFILYVTHGIFSNGIDSLFSNGIDEIWTTNSLPTPKSGITTCYDEKVHIMDLEERFADLL